MTTYCEADYLSKVSRMDMCGFGDKHKYRSPIGQDRSNDYTQQRN